MNLFNENKHIQSATLLPIPLNYKRYYLGLSVFLNYSKYYNPPSYYIYYVQFIIYFAQYPNPISQKYYSFFVSIF